ncbi:MATH domain and coiled-coil domain-containing protein At3g58220 [Vigna radiata var. radiata]|uniref:MATH domain and coiled-coil domain-containing protein At3g58220 n=1 Tax=Vigna radiata var. radiata TaxID=3916 RepID=A0A1S3VD34_VIGRR|nr:MATH domain and coiled-coil domain-containing protein At3g58220 [Vigna radiata var. radiata]
MENDNQRPKLTFEKYTWRINRFSYFKRRLYSSDKFILDGFPWYLISFPVRGPLEIYLQAHHKSCADLPEDWKRTVNVSFALINQVNDQKTIRKGMEFEFSADFLRSKSFVFYNDFNHSSGFIVNDTCMIEVGIFVMKNVYENEQYRTVHKNPDTENPLFHEMFMTSFANIDLNYVPLLEKVCLQYPYLLVSQEKRSCQFTEWAFIALGRVLYFLNTKKVKDMNDEACIHLKKLWDEVKIFGFDLSWLEFDVKSAINLKNYREKTANVRKAKAAVIEREIELERVKRDLVKAEEGFEKRDLDDVLGYGRLKN